MDEKSTWQVGPYYVNIEPTVVVVGDQTGAPFCDACGTCSYDAFLAGEFQDLVERNLGKDILAEVIQAVRRARGH
jgi:hypothetical protein